MTGALLVGAPRSGAGKTVFTAGLVAALVRRGHRVRALKCGPDYIDAAFHAAASGADCANIDSWAMSPGHIAALLAAEPDGLVVVESAMGLFDGIAGRAGPAGQSGAAADIAIRFDIPVVLVVDIAGQAQSAGAVAAGFAAFDPALEIAGAVLNGVASERHLRSASEGLAAAGVARLGWLPRRRELAFPDRHLGLVQARERPDLEREIAGLADQAVATVDLDRIAGLARPPRPLADAEGRAATRAPDPPGQRIALADDAAFSFIYPHMTQAWRRAGAEIVRFSPLADQPPPDGCDCCWLPGGYPELHAGRIAAAGRFLAGLRAFAATRPVHGECGGYMVLGRTLEGADGAVCAMAGLLGHSTSFRDRRLHLGYRRAVTVRDCVLGEAGATVRGHEFHYATIRDEAADDAFLTVFDGADRPLGAQGGRRGNVTGTFFHAIARDA